VEAAGPLCELLLLSCCPAKRPPNLLLLLHISSPPPTSFNHLLLLLCNRHHIKPHRVLHRLYRINLYSNYNSVISHHWLKTQDNEGDIHNVEDDADVDNNYIWQ